MIWCNGVILRSSDVCFIGRWLEPAKYHHVTTLGKISIRLPLSPSSIIWYWAKGVAGSGSTPVFHPQNLNVSNLDYILVLGRVGNFLFTGRMFVPFILYVGMFDKEYSCNQTYVYIQSSLQSVWITIWVISLFGFLNLDQRSAKKWSRFFVWTRRFAEHFAETKLRTDRSLNPKLNFHQFILHAPDMLIN